MKSTQIENIMLRVLYIFSAGIIILQLFDVERFISVLFYTTFVIEVVLWIFAARRDIGKQDFLCLITIYIAFMSVFINSWIENASITFSYVKKVIIFSSTLIFFQVASKIKVSQAVKRFVIITVVFISLCFIFMYYTQTSQMYEYRGIVSKYLTFRFSNPNLTSLFLVCFTIFEFIEVTKTHNMVLRLFHVVLVIMLVFFIVETQARNALIIIASFVAICTAVNLSNKNNYRIKGRVSIFVAMFPLVFMILYMILVKIPFINQLFGFLVSEGKELDSRVKIWGRAIEAFFKSPMFGAYSQISDGRGISQMHNTHIDVLTSYGIIVFIMFCSMLAIFIYNNNNKYNKESYLYMIGFMFAIIMGMGEAALVSGGLSLNLYIGAFLLLANCEKS